MAEHPARVVAVVRHREALLVCRRPDGGGSGDRQLPARPVDGAEPEAVLGSLLAELGIESPAVDRRGDPVEGDGARLHPFLVAATGRDVTEAGCRGEPAWEPPSSLRRSTSDSWWQTYLAVAPTVSTVGGDTERGSTAIAVDALWALRDAATLADASGGGLATAEATALGLLEARLAMAALGNRVNRAMAGAATPAEIERAATDGIVRAHAADAAAARLAAETVAGARVLTLSRSGTVRAALQAARPDVLVLASRPGGEGLGFAAALADDGVSVSTRQDAEVYACLRSGEADAVLVGADAVTPDGGVVNKVGTRAAGLAAEAAGVPCYVVCASDKVRPASETGDADRPPLEPQFDWTPPRLVTALLTDRGALAPEDVRSVAEEHRRLARWRA